MKVSMKFIGGILLIVGTSLGGGMLALPIGTASSGLLNTSVALIVCWVAMTLSAFFILEVNLYLPKGANMISMAQITLGKPGKIVTWITYLCLLYALLSAYISGGSDVFQSLLFLCNFTLPLPLITVLYAGSFAFIIYKGIKIIDALNSTLMYIKLIVYCLLLVLIAPKVSLEKLQGGHFYYLKNAVMLLITAYGFAIIIPTLRDYFDDDIAQLKKVILIGSLFPLFCYLAWVAVITGVVPKEGHLGLVKLMHDPHATSGLAHALEQAVHQRTISHLFRFFSAISMLTAFLGVSLCLFDFLADGIHFKKTGKQGYALLCLVFIPPLTLVLFYPGIYIKAMQYAGSLCVLLLLFLPSLMLYSGRYRQKRQNPHFITPGGKISVLSVLILSFCLLLYSIYLIFT